MADELCARCGTPLTVPPVQRNFARLCPRHLKEALATTPPFACTDADLREGETADEPCPSCGHRKREHGWDGCEVEYHTAAAPDFNLVGPHRCGCREWDPMCTAVESSEPPQATVTALEPRA